MSLPKLNLRPLGVVDEFVGVFYSAHDGFADGGRFRGAGCPGRSKRGLISVTGAELERRSPNYHQYSGVDSTNITPIVQDSLMEPAGRLRLLVAAGLKRGHQAKTGPRPSGGSGVGQCISIAVLTVGCRDGRITSCVRSRLCPDAGRGTRSPCCLLRGRTPYSRLQAVRPSAGQSRPRRAISGRRSAGRTFGPDPTGRRVDGCRPAAGESQSGHQDRANHHRDDTDRQGHPAARPDFPGRSRRRGSMGCRHQRPDGAQGQRRRLGAGVPRARQHPRLQQRLVQLPGRSRRRGPDRPASERHRGLHLSRAAGASTCAAPAAPRGPRARGCAGRQCDRLVLPLYSYSCCRCWSPTRCCFPFQPSGCVSRPSTVRRSLRELPVHLQPCWRPPLVG